MGLLGLVGLVVLLVSVRSWLLSAYPLFTKAQGGFQDASLPSWQRAMVRRLADPNTFKSKTPSQLKSLKKDLNRYLSLGRPRTRGDAESEPYAEAQLSSFRQQLAAVEAELADKEEHSGENEALPILPVEREGHQEEEVVRSMQQKRNVPTEENSPQGIANSSLGPVTIYLEDRDSLGAMESTEQEPIAAILPPQTDADTELQSAKRAKPTRVPNFTSNPQRLLELITNLQRTEQNCCRRLIFWATKKLNEEATNRSSAWSVKQLATAEATLKKVRDALENAAIEKGLIAEAGSR